MPATRAEACSSVTGSATVCIRNAGTPTAMIDARGAAAARELVWLTTRRLRWRCSGGAPRSLCAQQVQLMSKRRTGATVRHRVDRAVDLLISSCIMTTARACDSGVRAAKPHLERGMITALPAWSGTPAQGNEGQSLLLSASALLWRLAEWKEVRNKSNRFKARTMLERPFGHWPVESSWPVHTPALRPNIIAWCSN